MRTKLDIPDPPYRIEDIGKLPPDEQRRAMASLSSYVAMVKRMREEQDRLDAAAQVAPETSIPAPASTASPVRGTTYRGGSQRGAHHYSRGYLGGQHFGRGGNAGYSPYAGQPRFKNRSAVFHNADSSYETSDAEEAATFAAPPQADQQPAKHKELCATFTLTGECSRPRCSVTYDHDPTKLSICKTWLFKGNCPDGDGCSLSHEASEHNTPHCQHFQRGRCIKDDCPFPHIRLNPDAPNCEAFGQKGYCEKGSSCAELHAHECPTFANTGACRYGDRCRLGHILRASRMKKATRRSSDSPSPPSDSAKEGTDDTMNSDANAIKVVARDNNASDADADADADASMRSRNTEDLHHFSQNNDYVPLE